MSTRRENSAARSPAAIARITCGRSQGYATAQLNCRPPARTWTTAVPAGKQLTIEYVSGQFEKRITSASETNAAPLVLTLTTTSGASTVDHVVPIITGYIVDGVIGYYTVSQAVTVRADAGTNVTLRLRHLFSPGYRYEGAMSLSGRFDNVP